MSEDVLIGRDAGDEAGARPALATMPRRQTLVVFFDDDTRVNVRMKPERDITGWPLRFEVKDDNGVLKAFKDLADAEVEVVDALVGHFRFVLSPDLDGLAKDQNYQFRTRKTDAGVRGTINHGELIVLG